MGASLNGVTDFAWCGRAGASADAVLSGSDGVHRRGDRGADKAAGAGALRVDSVVSQCVAAVGAQSTGNADQAARHKQVLARFGGRFTSHPSFPFGETVLFVSGNTEDEIKGGVDHLARALSVPLVNIYIGVSRIGADSDHDNLVSQARRAALYASMNHSDSPVSVDDYPLEEALLDDQALLAAATAVLDPLEDHPEFLHTLYLYLAYDRNRQRVARRLEVHPRTVDYRLRRIAALTGQQPQTVSGASKLLIALVGKLQGDIAGESAAVLSRLTEHICHI